MDKEPPAVTIDAEVYRELLRLAVAAGSLGNSIEPEAGCGCSQCEFARAWHTFAGTPAVQGFLERKLAVEAAVRFLEIPLRFLY